jgi:hypothetical protein
MSEMRRLARHGTITVEIEGNTTAFEQQIPLLDDIGAVKYERVGSEFRMSFLGAEPLPVYIHRVLDLVDRIGVDLLHFNTGDDEIEEAFLRRLEEDRTRGFLRASAWAASQRLGSPIPTMLGSTNGANGTNGSNGAATVIESAATEVLNAGVPRPPAV